MYYINNRKKKEVVITDGVSELYFYKHQDGTPTEVLPVLEKFLSLVEQGKIRDDVEQASGWLIVFGRKEDVTPRLGMEWKVGDYNQNKEG